MLKNFFSDEGTPVDDLIAGVILEMDNHDPTSEDYLKLCNRLKLLNEIKTGNSRKPVSSDTLAMLAGGTLQIFMIFMLERTHSTMSKAWSYITRPKGY